MSIPAVALVHELNEKYIANGTDLLIMQCIASYCNENDTAIISYAEIARYARCSERTVFRRMGHLTSDEFGYMTSQQPRGSDGRKVTSIFRLNTEKMRTDNLSYRYDKLSGGKPKPQQTSHSSPPDKMSYQKENRYDKLSGGKPKPQQNSQSHRPPPQM